MLVVPTSWPIKRITVCTSVRQFTQLNKFKKLLPTTITHHKWQPLFANFWRITHPLNRPCICRQNSQSFKASFEVSILGSLDMSILKGMIKTIIEFGFCMIWRIIQIYSATFNTCYYFSAVSHVKILTNFQLPFNPSHGLLSFL